VDETIITINDGVPGPKPGNAGPPVDPTVTTKVIEWNDLEALERALEPGDVACVLAEPALTNIGIVLPDEGYHAELRRITRETGTLLIIDETHTICADPGGCTQAWGLEPDMVTLGKPIGSGVPAAVYGFGQAVADLVHADWDYHAADECGIGGTLAGNMLSVAAVRATLGEVLTEEAYGRMIPLAGRWADGVQDVIGEFALPWVVKRLGCRAEYWPRPSAPRNGGEAAAAEDEQLDRYLHLFMLNRGILMTPFHNMALMAPQTSAADVDRHTEVFREAARTLIT
jgi:glutamate-1-semialdehyde 2,1-aminomutase